jgi:hypothetical protein
MGLIVGVASEVLNRTDVGPGDDFRAAHCSASCGAGLPRTQKPSDLEGFYEYRHGDSKRVRSFPGSAVLRYAGSHRCELPLRAAVVDQLGGLIATPLQRGAIQSPERHHAGLFAVT